MHQADILMYPRNTKPNNAAACNSVNSLYMPYTCHNVPPMQRLNWHWDTYCNQQLRGKLFNNDGRLHPKDTAAIQHEPQALKTTTCFTRFTVLPVCNVSAGTWLHGAFSNCRGKYSMVMGGCLQGTRQRLNITHKANGTTRDPRQSGAELGEMF